MTFTDKIAQECTETQNYMRHLYCTLMAYRECDFPHSSETIQKELGALHVVMLAQLTWLIHTSMPLR